ncbi:MAG: FeoB-associated Cys-rich membrane protein [Verrucomicrobia bacterium]|nr:FeoB-associated Cys-rich membrane protein [Verrucomicrobiota bacterium]
MTPEIQTILALGIVVIAVVSLAWRYFGKRKNPGCGGDCGCASSKLKDQLRG